MVPVARLALVAIVAATPAAADCGGASPDAVTVESWYAAGKVGSVDVKMSLKNRSGKDFRMIKADVRFYDPFDEPVAVLAIPPDIKVRDGEVFLVAGEYFAARLAKVDPADVTAIACTKGLVFADGTKKVFE